MKPIAVFDLETTGINPATCRIVELGVSFITMAPDSTQWWVDQSKSIRYLINPGEPIPEHAAKIHGIHDSDVKDAKSFADIAQEIADLLTPCDLAGYNILRFDLPVLVAEFARTNVSFDPYACNLIDAMTIFHQREPRNLTAAFKFYCDSDLDRAHSADADAAATAMILLAQIDHYNLEQDSKALADLCKDPNAIDRAGKFRFQDDLACISFGKHRGTSLAKLSRSYLSWMINADFEPDTKQICRNALAGRFPERKGS